MRILSAAVELLSQYDFHASVGMMVHFAIADAAGRSVVVEYIDNGEIRYYHREKYDKDFSL